jgi:hypothetical protein
MKHVLKFAIATLALVAVGCGGSGNQPAPSTITVANGTPRIEAIVKVLPTNLMHPDTWTPAQLLNPQTPGLQADLINPTVFGIQDPTNIECGEKMVFQVVTYSTDGTRNILPATFTSSDATGVYGTLAGNTGDYTAGNTATSQPFTVTGTVNGSSYSTQYDIKIEQVRLLGTVLTQGTNANQLAGTLLQFYNASGALVDTVTVQSDGSFRASVPVVATSFTVVADSIPQTFYQSSNYLGLQYDAGVVTCFAPLPSGLTVGTTSLTGTVYVSPRVTGQGTPPSTGCSDSGGKAHVIKKN